LSHLYGDEPFGNASSSSSEFPHRRPSWSFGLCLLHYCGRHSWWWAVRVRDVRHIALSVFWRCQALFATADGAFIHCHASIDDC
jgi:hypothetical protein